MAVMGMGSLSHVLASTLKRLSPRQLALSRLLLNPSISTSSHPRRNMTFVAVERGTTNTTDYRIYFRNEQGPISPFHDIPTYADEAAQLCNMVVEIPRWTNPKMEISREDPLNPIKQDIKKGKLRFVANSFPHHGYIWNYGAIPQTWEKPDVLDEHTGFKGDNDPVDVLEIGTRVAKRGEILQVKVLGCIGLIDEGETDWKIVSIDRNDPLADSVKDILDVDKFFPGLLKATVEWLRIYKIPDGKPENQFAFNAEFQDRNFALKVIQEVRTHWETLMKDPSVSEISCKNTTIPDSPANISYDEAEELVKAAPDFAIGGPVDDSVGKWHFLHLK